MEQSSIITLLLVIFILQLVIFKNTKSNNKIKIRPSKQRDILVDTSVLMDGRILEIAKTGFIGGQLLVPRSVVAELQLLADGSDSEKRERARYGLDVIKDLQDIKEVDVAIYREEGDSSARGVDDKLLEIAKANNSLLLTLDYNLNKVAQVEGIKVLNINELAHGLRMPHLPGEFIDIKLVQKGNEQGQAVGYSDEGTMTVVDRSAKYIGKTKKVEIVRSLQTAAGLMNFARLANESEKAPAKNVKNTNSPVNAKTASKEDQKPQRTYKNSKKQSPKNPNNKQPDAKDNNNRGPKPAKKPSITSKAREDDLINLVNNQ